MNNLDEELEFIIDKLDSINERLKNTKLLSLPLMIRRDSSKTEHYEIRCSVNRDKAVCNRIENKEDAEFIQSAFNDLCFMHEILKNMLTHHTVVDDEELEELEEEPESQENYHLQTYTDDTKVSIGNYSNKKLGNIPGSYLLKVKEEPDFGHKNPLLLKYINENIALLESEG